MASSSPHQVTTGLRRPPSRSTSAAAGGHGSTHPSSDDGRRNEDTLNWCAWPHQGHRLWAGMPDSFWVYTYKVERCRFPDNHVWMTCPFAHRGERARRRDLRAFAYAAASCPERVESKRLLQLAGSSATPACPRGLRCGYAHSIFETWLHPTRFRTVMCDRGAECSRRICFFAHSLAQRRREDDEVPLVVFAAAAAAQPAAHFVPRAPAAASSSSISPSCSRSVSVVTRPVDRVAQAMQQGHTVCLLTRQHSDAAGASSSSSSSTTTSRAAAATAPALLQPSPPSPVDDDDIDLGGHCQQLLPRRRGRF